eukprot:Awhi_evm1s367
MITFPILLFLSLIVFSKAFSINLQQPPFSKSKISIHVPMYNPYLSTTSKDFLGMIWAAKQPNAPTLLATVATKESSIPALRLLREAGVKIYHYVPAQKIPVQGPAECCGSLESIEKMVKYALGQEGASNDGIFFDFANSAMLDQSRSQFFKDLYDVARQDMPNRPLIINPSMSDVFFEDQLEMGTGKIPLRDESSDANCNLVMELQDFYFRYPSNSELPLQNPTRTYPLTPDIILKRRAEWILSQKPTRNHPWSVDAIHNPWKKKASLDLFSASED